MNPVYTWALTGEWPDVVLIATTLVLVAIIGAVMLIVASSSKLSDKYVSLGESDEHDCTIKETKGQRDRKGSSNPEV